MDLNPHLLSAVSLMPLLTMNAPRIMSIKVGVLKTSRCCSVLNLKRHEGFNGLQTLSAEGY